MRFSHSLCTKAHIAHGYFIILSQFKYLLYKSNIYISTQKQSKLNPQTCYIYSIFSLILSFLFLEGEQYSNLHNLLCFFEKNKQKTSFHALYKELQIWSPTLFLTPYCFFLSPILTSPPSSFLLSSLQDFSLLSLHLPHKGKTRNPEKVEYFQPPIRLPLSSLR